VQKVQGRQAVADWLNEHNLGQYYQKFVDCGYESLEVCALIDDTELVAMDIGKPGHRKALLQACQQLKENAALGKTVGIDEKNKKWKEQQEWPNKVEQKEKIDQFSETDQHIPIPITREKEPKQQTPLSTSIKAEEEQSTSQLHVQYSLDSESSDTIFSESEQEEDIFANK